MTTTTHPTHPALATDSSERATPRAPRRRSAAILSILLAVTIALLTGCLTPEQNTVVQELNSDRVAHGLRSLPIDFEASAKAQAWAEKLAREGELYHSNLRDGFVGKRPCTIRENVGFGPTVDIVQGAYMNSPSHRAAVLSADSTAVGVGFARNGDTVWTVHVFVRRC